MPISAVVLVRLAVRGGEARGAVEDDDVAAPQAVDRDQLVDQDPVARLDGRLHRPRRDVEGLHEETPDQQHHQQGDADQQQPRRAAAGALGLGRRVGLDVARRPGPAGVLPVRGSSHPEPNPQGCGDERRDTLRGR